MREAVELYAFFVFEEKLRQAMSATHPSQFLFSTSSPGLSDRIGLLKQNVLMLQRFLEGDADTEYYEEL